MFVEKRKPKGFLLTEMTIALTIFSLLFLALAISLHTFAKFNRYQLVRQRCISAAQAQLDSIAVTGKPISTEDFKRLWPKLNISMKKSDAAGQWQGMKLVKVTAKGNSFNKIVKVELSRYILDEEGR